MTHAPDTANSTQRKSSLDPLAICTLPPRGLSERLAWVRAEILPHAIANQWLEDGIAYEFDDVPGLANKLDQLIARELECCSDIVFDHQRSRTDGRRRLEIHGVDPNASVFASLLVEPTSPPRVGARLAKAAGLGALVSLIVCCVLPIAAAAVLGGAAAAPLASLDSPWIIAGAALLAGAAAFAWQNRQHAAAPTAESQCGPGC
jgi:hypothetical protein